jgi:hypothetical protein
MGIGVPSKYFDLPVASLGTMATVTLKRARRVRPQRTKKARRRWSTGVRRPRLKAAAAGPTPKETWCIVNYWKLALGGPKRHIGAYQVGEGVQFLTHKTGLLPPPSDLTIHKVEKQA